MALAKQSIKIRGMHCNSCVFLIKEALEDAGARDVQVTLDSAKNQGKASFVADLTKEQIKIIVQSEGAYTVE